MTERIATVFDQHYRRTSDQPDDYQYMMLKDKESNYDWERDGEPVIQAIANAASIPDTAAKDIQAILAVEHSDFEADKMGEETEFSSESYYEEKGVDDQAWQLDWQEFERSLKTEARFFSRTAAAHLASVFKGIQDMSATDGRPLLINAGPETSLSAIYRARTFQSDELLVPAICRPDQHIGSPPAHLAGAGRMNARGISVFYGANNPKVAIAEVRPPVGSQVAVARFSIIRKLRLLDLTALSTVIERGSIFDPEFASRLERAVFLQSLSQRMTRPVMPDDEAFDYLPTQAIADFLATENEPTCDGIIYPSIQAVGDALNVVLFHHAARVETLNFPEGTTITATTGQMYPEGWESEYVVDEEVPPAPKPTTTNDDRWRPFAPFADGQFTYDHDFREPTLRIDTSSIIVHQIRRVEFETDEHKVHRHRREKNDTKF